MNNSYTGGDIDERERALRSEMLSYVNYVDTTGMTVIQEIETKKLTANARIKGELLHKNLLKKL